MNVFVLGTGRCGTTTFTRASEHIENFTAGHETRVREVGEARLSYPEDHIEVDHYLSWFLGRLDDRYGEDAFYVHLLRDKRETAESWNERWIGDESVMRAYAAGLHLRPEVPRLPEEKRLEFCEDYWETVNRNIRSFLDDKPDTMTIWLSEAKEQFPSFWDRIGAEGDLEAALEEWDRKHNARNEPSEEAPGKVERLGRKTARVLRKFPDFLRSA